MADPLSAVAVGAGLVGYNRQNWMWDKTLLQKREYQGQAMNIKRFELYREDVRDLAELTISKMDNYLLINILLMGFCVKIFTEGRPHPLCSPSWLHWLYSATVAGALMYFMLSVWLAMHASIASHSFEVRLLTQFVRLPIPSKEQIDAARFHAQDFETRKAGDLLRIPVISEMFRSFRDTMNRPTSGVEPEAPAEVVPGVASEIRRDTTAADVAGPATGLTADRALEAEAARFQHVKLYRQVQSNWQAYDAYARVSMAMGVNQLMHGMSYFALIMFVGENHVTWPALTCTMAFAGCAYLLARLDLFVSREVLRRAGLMMVVPPIMSFMYIVVDRSNADDGARRIVEAFVPVIFLFHIYWIYFIIQTAKAEVSDDMALPVKFRNVLFLDVYGWVRSVRERAQNVASSVAATSPSLVCPQVETSLVEWCHDRSVRLDRELCIWENPDIQELMSGLQVTVYMHCRARFNEILGTVRTRLLDSDHHGILTREVPESGQEVWAKLEHEQAGRVKVFYQRPGDTEPATKPPNGAAISDLDALQDDIIAFDRKVKQLLQMLDSRGSRGPVPAPPSPTPPRAPVVPRWRQQGASASVQSAASVSATSVSTLRWAQDREHEEFGNPAQETRFGGREALELSSAPRLLGTGAEAAATFAPEPEQGGRREHLQRPPGHFPWMLFFQGSAFLIFVWCVGLIWCLLQLSAGLPISLKPRNPALFDAGVRMPRRPELIFSSPLPHGLFSPRGLACHGAAGPELLVAEPHTVHALRLADRGAGGWRGGAWAGPALEACLRRAPAFQDGGLKALSLWCGEPAGPRHRCEVVLLGAGGREVLRCPLEGAGVGAATGPSTVHGGPWSAFAAGSGSWAVKEDGGALLSLRPRRAAGSAAAAELVPAVELAAGSPGGVAVSALHELRGGTLLGLRADGRLSAWLPGTGRRLEWELPRSTRWVGLCEAGGQLYLAGVERGDRGPFFGIWRAALPPELQSAAATGP